MATPVSNEFASMEAWRAAFAEFIATLLFVFLGAGTVVVTGGVIHEGVTSARLVAIALAHGLSIAILVSATAKISGGHINPAVTVGALMIGRISLPRAVMYIVAQLGGAVVGAFLLTVVIPVGAQGNLGSHGLGPNVTAGGGVLAEIILTFVLVFVIFATAVDPKGLVHLAPAAIGLAVLVDHLFGVPVTGASMNPARSFGPALISGSWDNHWIYWIGPLLGGILAVLVYENFFLHRKE